MLHRLNYYSISRINCLKTESGKTFFRLQFFILFLFLSFSLLGQWVNDPAINNKLVADTKDPKNITAVENPEGGIFLFWQDNNSLGRPDIFYQFINLDGNTTFGSKGKAVSENLTKKEKPIVSNSINNSTVIIWQEKAKGKTNLFAQRVDNTGFLVWGKNPIQVIESASEVIDYSLSTDHDGNTYIVYIEKDRSFIHNFRLKIQRVSAIGDLEDDLAGHLIDSSTNYLNLPSILPSGHGSCYIFWTEYLNKKNKILVKKLLVDNTLDWDSKALDLSGNQNSVINYKVMLFNTSLVYIVWQTHGREKSIYHQLFTHKGGVLWNIQGNLITTAKGQNYNPQPIIASDSSIIVSWINEHQQDKNILVQKFWLDGKLLWKDDGENFIKLTGDQFGQLIVPDNRGGAIVAWFDSREPKMKPNIYAQKLNKKGEALWGEGGSPVAIHPNSEKSYFGVFKDQNNGLISVFKDKRNNNSGLFGQRIFSNNTYTSTIINFTTRAIGDSVQLLWETVNDANIRFYRIERVSGNNFSDDNWESIATIETGLFTNEKIYRFNDKPSENGTIYYRIVQIDNREIEQFSDVSRVNYFYGDEGEITVYQNSPNPFSNTTTIEFTLPVRRSVKIEIYNARVEEVKKITIEDTKSGRNKFVFDGSDLQPGVYFYRFIAGSFVEVKKMVISR